MLKLGVNEISVPVGAIPVFAEERRDGQNQLWLLCDLTTPPEYVNRKFLLYNTNFGQDGVAIETLRYVCSFRAYNNTPMIVCEVLNIGEVDLPIGPTARPATT